MRNKEFLKLLKKNKSKSNSGFTLTELLVGVIMSTFVIGALGFGLMQVLRVTQEGNSATAARNEASRALEFITDELRRAQYVEVDTSIAYLATIDNGATPNIDEEVAPTFNPLQDSAGNDIVPSLVLRLPNVDERIIYTVAPALDPWKGPLVIYRWGPNLNADGSYSNANNPGAWSSQALVDEVDDTTQNLDCDGDGTDENYQGFFACVVDNDRDSFIENATDTNGDGEITSDDDPTDTNGDGNITAADGFSDTNGDGAITAADDITDMNSDGEINEQDGADVDGRAITAQLYFTGGTIANSGSSGYSAETQAVARARTAPENNSEDLNSYTMSFRTLNPSFACNNNPADDWEMRTDFGQNFGDLDDLTQWNHIENRQPQPIKITGDTLIISSIPRNTSGNCLNSRDNNGREADRTPPRDFSGNKTLGENDDWMTNDDVVAISHAINFKDPRTFNGDPTSCTSYPCADSTYGNGTVYSQKNIGPAAPNPAVKILKHGSTVPDYGGYDPENDGTDADNDGVVDTGNQQSLGEFLASQNPPLAVADGTYANGNTKYKITDKLQPDERIIAFEIGKDTISSSDPGVDFQDNIFVVSSKAFKEKYSQYKDNGITANYTPLN